MVEYVDGSVLAQMSPNDMRFPILYALTYPDRVPPTPLEDPLDLLALGTLSFEALDESRYPAVPLAAAALRTGGSAPAVLNAANEVAVEAFLKGASRTSGSSKPSRASSPAQGRRRLLRGGGPRGRRLGAARSPHPPSGPPAGRLELHVRFRRNTPEAS